MIFVALLGNDQLVMLQPAFHDCFDLAQVEWLHHIVERAEAHRLDSALHCLQAADHDHHRVGRDLLYVRHHFQPAHAGHRDVADHQAKFTAAQTIERLLRGTSCLAFKFGG